ncbi:FixH family protein [Paenibacillus sp. IB182496]|uniref:FixH family protein n=1 Tax=Paenibacillus sabuli TaxID=2772509 RepID=A0A927BXT3_9BACL|nr:FixH family protein [Paenibacillus sabuli]MBD2847389.1 FixH family protein [Paenibacillus sabuli]
MKRLLPLLLLCGALAQLIYIRIDREQALAGNGARYRDAGFDLRIAADFEEARSMEPSAFRIELKDDTGAPVDGTSLRLSITMPGMLCGTIPGEIAEIAPGVYRATAIPVMAGSWQARASLGLAGVEARVSTDFEVK